MTVARTKIKRLSQAQKLRRQERRKKRKRLKKSGDRTKNEDTAEAPQNEKGPRIDLFGKRKSN